MVDTEQSVILEIIKEAIGTNVDLDSAVGLTYILNNYLIRIEHKCYGTDEDFRTPIEMTLRYSCEIVCQLQITGASLDVTTYNGWMTVWNSHYLQIYDSPDFKNLVQKLIKRLSDHQCISDIAEYPT